MQSDTTIIYSTHQIYSLHFSTRKVQYLHEKVEGLLRFPAACTVMQKISNSHVLVRLSEHVTQELQYGYGL